jgi:protein-S-isoprenylcysteine O-methyltransferase Ste14
LGSVVFFLLAPCVVAGVVPWWLTRWEMREPLGYWTLLRLLGIAVLVAGAVVLMHSFVRFVVEGVGTPAPAAPTEHLVVGGLYRFVRNPMYIAVVAAIIGQGLLLWQPVLFVYAFGLSVVFACFVHWYEEPRLARRFGDEYDAYRRAVPAWLPRLRPWRPHAGDSSRR